VGEKNTESNLKDAQEGWPDFVRQARMLAGLDRVEEVLEIKEAVEAI
jgi:hypothetical protein